MLLSIHNALKSEYESNILGTVSYDKINPDLNIKKNEYEYINLSNLIKLNHSVIFVHERKFLFLFHLFIKLFLLEIDVIYIHHSLLYGHKYLTWFPDHVVGISDSGIENLISYFGVPKDHISKIHNCVEDTYRPYIKTYKKDGIIHVLVVANITDVKRQKLIYTHLKDTLRNDVVITFAGTGTDLAYLQEKTKHDGRFNFIGFSNNVKKLIMESDYTMLFSEKEGLPISLIESAMLATPVICNNVGGNTEIVENEYNGFVRNDWEQLSSLLNSLQSISEENYQMLCKNSRDRYLSCFSVELFNKKYLSLVREMGVRHRS